jgi:hypothetical protein
MTKTPDKVGRIALRVEGGMWNAYYAMPDTMEGAILIGSIKMGAVTHNPGRKQAFMEMMTDTVQELFEAEIGKRAEFTVGPAPESERSGSA